MKPSATRCSAGWPHARTWPDGSPCAVKLGNIFFTGCCTPISRELQTARQQRIEEESLEDDGFVAVEEDAVFNVPANRARQCHAFHVAALFDKVFERVAVRDARDALLNDRAVIENFGDVMRRGADELHAALVGLVMRLGADKRRQERVMNVDDLLRIVPDEIRG